MSSFYDLFLIVTALVAPRIAWGCDLPCGYDAECDSGTNTCVCPAAKPLGDPNLACYEASKVACFAIADPAVTAFSGAKNRLNFPCKYVLAQLDTPSTAPVKRVTFAEEVPENNNCRFVIHGTNSMTADGRYYLESINVTVIVKNEDAPEDVVIQLKDGDFSGSFFGTPFQPFLADGNVTTFALNGRIVNVMRSIATGQYVLTSPDCGDTTVAFREIDPTNFRGYRAGVAIITEKTSDFSDPESSYPYAQCDDPDGNIDVYSLCSQTIGVQNPQDGALHAFLTTTLYTTQPSDLCEDFVAIFPTCADAGLAAGGIETCGPILNELVTSCQIFSLSILIDAFQRCANSPSFCVDARRLLATNSSCPSLPAFPC